MKQKVRQFLDPQDMVLRKKLGEYAKTGIIK